MTTILVPVVANERDIWTTLDSDIAEMFAGKRLSLGSHGYVQNFHAGRVEVVHRIVMGCVRGDGRIVDHIDGDRLNNTRSNLRLVTAAENTQNRHQRRPHRGAYIQRSGRWQACVQANGKKVSLGTYDTPEEAAAVAAAYRREHFSACAT